MAQAAAPDSRIVYVDDDPIVMARARALLTSDPAGRTACIQADLVASQTTADFNNPGQAADGMQAVQRAGVLFQTRTAEEFVEVAIAGLELVPPGLVMASEWRPEVPGPRPVPSEVAYYGAVGRKAGSDG